MSARLRSVCRDIGARLRFKHAVCQEERIDALKAGQLRHATAGHVGKAGSLIAKESRGVLLRDP
jgi:hypothetical protein